ncbi:beta-lactamase class C protein [Pandoraea terrae]|uniref:Beta-lactamase class C protein n=1 Tax=Pandoraea terrae TaxID=1537710 RepID=A0A5E4TQX6_9BURK|nr:serine hydrolase domain-containing protein [Pandoraea terrae]VVD90167.1 beta-lactamase class C protein [Pandoraea terrae]
MVTQANEAGFSTERLQRLSDAMRGYVERKEVAGLVAMVYRKGVLAHCDVLGAQDVETRAPMRRDSLFRIASMSKPVTSVAAMMLIEEGRLLLDDPIERWLPEFANPQVLCNPDGPLDEVRPAARSITVRDLLVHRSGLSYPVTASGPLAEALFRFNTEVLPAGDPDAWLKALGALPLTFEPGARWHYGFSTDVLGLLVARVAGCTFPEFLRTRIFEPLGMNDTGFAVRSQSLDRLTTGYVTGPAPGELIAHDHPERRVWNQTGFPSGGAGLISTADDYMKFARMLLGNGRGDADRILSRKSVELMTTNFLTPEERSMPFMGIPGFWGAQGFGLGLAVIDNAAQQATLGSTGQYGWPGAYGTCWQADPDEDMVYLLMIQLYWSTQCRIAQHFQSLVYAAIDD